jgi:hypothetical protein
LSATVDKSIIEIHRIAEQEVQRLGEGTPEGHEWHGFGAESLLTDVWRAGMNIQWEIAAVRGRLVYRQLDTSLQNFIPLNQVAAQQSASQDPE